MGAKERTESFYKVVSRPDLGITRGKTSYGAVHIITGGIYFHKSTAIVTTYTALSSYMHTQTTVFLEDGSWN